MTLESGKKKRVGYDYDQFNNVISMVEYDWGTGSPRGVLRRTTREYATTINGYCYSGLNALSGSCASTTNPDTSSIIHQRRLMLSEVVKDGGLNQEARTEIEYDNYLPDLNHSAIAVNANMIKYNSNRFAAFNPSFQPRGNVTSVRRWITGSTYSTGFSQYDEAGQVVKAIDPLGRATTISYTDNFGDGSFPDSGSQGTNGATYAMGTMVTNALGHVVKSQYDYTRGGATGIKDANGIMTRAEYQDDPYDRLRKITTGHGLSPLGSENAVTEMSYPTASLNESKVSRQLDTTRWLSSRTQYDGFGRAVLASQNEDGLHYSSASWSIHTKAIYDGLGRAVKATNPYRSTPTATDGWTRSTYDLAGRMTEAATFSGSPSSPPPDTGTNANWTGSVVTSYNGEVTTVRDQANKQRRSTIDGLGRLKTIEELYETGLVYATTMYGYDARGNLKQVNQSTQTPRMFSYDGLSRLTSASNPESGPVSYTYDLNSNLKTKQDARPVTTNYDYDELNRVTMRNYSDTTADVTYVYDPVIANGKGKLASVTSSVSGYNYTAFDAMGRVTQYNQQTASQLYMMSATYNKGGLMATETYPSGKVIETQYDGAGRIAGVKKQSLSTFIAGAASSDAANRMQYTAHGGMSAMKLGNGLWEHVNFNSRLQPTQIGLGTTSTTSERLQLDYGYGASASVNNGNITSQQIIAPGFSVTQNYSYDQVNRLSNASEGANWTQQYGYDVYGNRWVSSGYKPNPTLTPQSQSAFNAANNRIVLAGFNYDAVGNLTSDPTTAANAMVYDAENRQTSYTKAGATTSYSYDGDGRRVKKVDSTGTTVFVYNAAGQLVAEYTDAATSGTVTMNYLTTDHLGSTRVVTDGAGAVKARHDYLPFGEEIETSIGGRNLVTGYAAADSTRQRFTSKERDIESGLDYFGARYYSGAQGRFTSVDPQNIVFEKEQGRSAEERLRILQSYLVQPQNWNRYA